MRRQSDWFGWLLVCGILVGLISTTRADVRPDWTAAVQKGIAEQLDRLETLYKQLHAQPELSLQEEQTAARMARELREIGFEVTEKVGGFGVVGVLRNGKGPIVLVRTDLDALPVVERTSLPYASKVRARDRNG